VENSPWELMVVGWVHVPVGGSGKPVPVTVMFDGKGKGGVLFKDEEIILLDQNTGSVGVIIVTKTSVYVLVRTLPDIVVSVMWFVVGKGGATVAVQFKLLVAALILDLVRVFEIAVLTVELTGPWAVLVAFHER
jgi:hypothetical protein